MVSAALVIGAALANIDLATGRFKVFLPPGISEISFEPIDEPMLPAKGFLPPGIEHIVFEPVGWDYRIKIAPAPPCNPLQLPPSALHGSQPCTVYGPTDFSKLDGLIVGRKLVDMPLKDAMTLITTELNVPFKLLDRTARRSVTLEFPTTTLDQALDHIFTSANVTYDFKDGVIVVHAPQWMEQRKYQGDLRAALRDWCGKRDLDYSFSPELRGSIDVDISYLSDEHGLRRLLRNGGATYRVESGVYQFVRQSWRGTCGQNPP
jgi:hypothetical protein